MAREKTLEEAYKECESGGLFQDQDLVGFDKIKTILKISQNNIEIADQVKKSLDKKDMGWNVIYKLYYDALMELAEALIRFEKKKIPNHQCLFAYLCTKHSEFDFSWDFFEKVRTKRNGINYYGKPVKYEDFKEVELQLNLYTKILKEKIEEKLKNKIGEDS